MCFDKKKEGLGIKNLSIFNGVGLYMKPRESSLESNNQRKVCEGTRGVMAFDAPKPEGPID